MIINQSLIKNDPLYKKFQNYLDENFLLKKNDKIVVSISGGRDSVTLLILLFVSKRYNLVNAHINHNLFERSDKCNLFVKKISNQLNIPFFSKNLDPEKKNKSTSTEEWARNERYLFLNNVLKKTDSKYIMTAHHGNDQLETLLMNLSRKTGVSGLKGISKKRGEIIRPMLNMTKKEIIDFSNRTNLRFVNDPTNLDISIPRNFIRHMVIKPWELNYHHLIEGATKSMQYFCEWEFALDYLIIEFLVPSLKKYKDRFDIPFEIISELPKIVKIRLIKILTHNKTELWSKHKYELINQFLNKNDTGNIFYFSNGWVILHDRNRLIGEKIKMAKDVSREISPNKTIIIKNFRFEINLGEEVFEIERDQNIEVIDWEKIKDKKLVIRNWRNGDAFQPLGMMGKQKVSDFLINEKVNRISKSSQFVFTADDEIFWVCGKRISDWAKVTNKTVEKAKLIYKS